MFLLCCPLVLNQRGFCDDMMFLLWFPFVLNNRSDPFQTLQHFQNGRAVLGFFIPAPLHQFPQRLYDGRMFRSCWAFVLIEERCDVYAPELGKWPFAGEYLYVTKRKRMKLTKGLHTGIIHNIPRPSASQRRRCLIPCCTCCASWLLARSIAGFLYHPQNPLPNHQGWYL